MNTTTIWKAAVIVLLAATASFAAEPAKDDKQAAKGAADADAAAGPARFYGTITKIDADAKTFTIDDQTYTVTGESKLTKGDKDATLKDAVVGEPARGTYTKAEGGAMNVTKVRFGKKAGGGKGNKKKDKPKEAPAAEPAK